MPCIYCMWLITLLHKPQYSIYILIWFEIRLAKISIPANMSTTAPIIMETPPTLLVTPQSKRKFSFPVNTIHSTVLLGADVSLMSARRRLSNVSDAVSRKLSNTIGWKVAAVPAPEIITQGKCLCGQYVRGRLKRSGVYNKKMGLHRMRSFIGTSSIHVVRDVYPALNNVSAFRTDFYLPYIY